MSKQRKQPESSKNITKLLDDSIRNLNKVKQYLAKNETVKSGKYNRNVVKISFKFTKSQTRCLEKNEFLSI